MNSTPYVILKDRAPVTTFGRELKARFPIPLTRARLAPHILVPERLWRSPNAIAVGRNSFRHSRVIGVTMENVKKA